MQANDARFCSIMSGLAVLTKNAVMPSRGVDVQECIVVPAPPLNSSEEKRTEDVVDAQASVTGSICRMCSTVQFGGMLKCNMGL